MGSEKLVVAPKEKEKNLFYILQHNTKILY